ncbi:hypothetical protein RvY_09910 [Ramazzottius varieornatus]|uniref:Uncharacterized protein n=1 Tax=Ramazzottius varieornatus TaxID=947166 RepID=A0A1D1VGC6_RAMVA|nr:hypothetical protein RvY_09910 [Ramazzottius varieornatus]
MIVFGILACLLFIGAIVVLIKSWRKKKRRQKVARKVAFRENPTGPPLSVPVRMEKVALALKMGDVTTPEKTPEVTPRPTRTTVKFASQTSVRFDEDASQVADQQEA